MKPVQKTYSNFISRWLGRSSSDSLEAAPLQLMALEDRVLYSAGPVPVEAVSAGADLLSQGDFQGLSASELGLSAVESDVTNTIEFLQAQIDLANSVDSIVDIQAVDNGSLDGDLSDSDALGVIDASQIVAVQATAVDSVVPDERVTAAVSVGFANGVSISGRVLHDVDGDGNVDENQALEGVEVTLVRDAGDGVLRQFDVDSYGSHNTTTDANGFYQFTDLEVGGTYFVVVNSLTLGEHFEINGLLNSNFSAEDVWGVQTYASEGALFDRGAGQEVHSGGAFYGGYDINQSDSPDIVDNFQHIIRHSSLSVDAIDVDFGFSFNVVTNTRGGDLQSDSVNLNQSVQGSLRQFITNANGIVGGNEMRFVPVVDASQTLSTGDIWRIDVANVLPTITDAGTSINSLGYHTDGSLIATNPFQLSLGGGSLGFGVADDILGPASRPLLELSGVGLANNEAGLFATADQFEVSNLALVNFRTGIAVDGEDVRDTAIFDNFIGVHADGTEATALQTNGVAVVGADDGRIEGNYIVDFRRVGVNIDGQLGTIDQAENWLIGSNYVFNRDGFAAFATSDGISLTGGTEGATVINNRIENSNEFGIELWNNRGAITILGNTITGAGSVRTADGIVLGGGIGLTFDGNVVQGNEILNSVGTGILVRGTALSGGTDIVSATGNLISQNYFEANAGLDIDITRPQDLLAGGMIEIEAGDGLDAIDGVLDADTGSNGIDRPEISTVEFQDDTLVIEGSILNLINEPKVELYLLGPNGSKLYFDSVSVADQTSYDPATGAFSAALVEPAEGWPSELVLGADVAAIVIDGATSDTSEFSLATSVTLVNQPADFDTDESEFFVDENTTFVTNFEATDPEGGGVNYSIVGGPDAGLFTITSSTGILDFINAPDFENPSDSGGDNVYQVIVNVQDGQGFGTDRESTITVDDTDEVAVFDQLSFQGNENSFISFQLNAGIDADALGDDVDGFVNPGFFRYQLEEGGDSEFVTVSEFGQVLFDTPQDFENPNDLDLDSVYSFTVVATSNTGFSIRDEISVEIIDLLETTQFEQNENQQDIFTFDVAANDNSRFMNLSISGPDSDSFVFFVPDDSSSSLTFQFVSAPDFEIPADSNSDGVYEFFVEGTTDTGFVLGETILVTVVDGPENAPPPLVQFSQEENSDVSHQLTAIASDGSALTYELIERDTDDSGLITLDETSGVFQLVDIPDFENPIDASGDNVYTFTVLATSGFGVVEQQISLTVTDVVEFVQTEFSQEENADVSHQLNPSGFVGNEFTYELLQSDADDSGLIFLDNDSGEFSLFTVPDFENSDDLNTDNVYTFTVVATSDTTGFSLEQQINLTVTDALEIAEIDTTEFFAPENQTTEFTLSATAVDGSDLTYSAVGPDQRQFTFTPSGDDLVFQLDVSPDFENPTDANDDGIYEFILTATSDTGFAVTETIRVIVEDVNEIATLLESDFNQQENVIVSHQLNATAPDGSTFIYELLDGNDSDLVSLDNDTGEFSLFTAPDFENAGDADTDNVYTFTVVATSDTGFIVEQEIDLTVTDSLEIATLLESEFNQQENVIVSHQLNATAPDSSTFTYELQSDDGQIILNESTGEFRLADVPDFENPTDGNGDNVYTFTVVATSDTGFTVEQQINLTVADTPETVDDSLTVDLTREPSISIDLLENDLFDATVGDDFELQIVSGPSIGSISISGSLVEYTPFPGAEGTTDSFSYQLVSADGEVRSNVAQVSVTLRVDDVDEADRPDLIRPATEPESNGDDDSGSGPEVVTEIVEGMGLTPLNEDEDETRGRPPSIPAPIEFESFRRPAVDASVLNDGPEAAALLDYESNVYSYLGRTQFLDLAKQELSSTLEVDSIYSQADFSRQLSLSQFVAETEDQDASSERGISDLNLGDPPFLSAGFAAVAFLSIGTLMLTSTQIPRFLDIGQLLEESIEEIVSS